jgi:PAS domain-containing protein
MIPIARDGRDQGKAPAVNAASAERYRTLFQTMPQGVVYYAADGSVIGVNPAASEILGFDLGDRPTTPAPPSRPSSPPPGRMTSAC